MCMCERYFKLSSECFQLIINMLKSWSHGPEPTPAPYIQAAAGATRPHTLMCVAFFTDEKDCMLQCSWVADP